MAARELRTLVGAIALVATSALAAGPCTKLEYAEMDAMAREELLALRCEYKTALYESIGRANETAKSRGIYAAAPYMAAMDRCSSELDRMDRILARKYAVTGGRDATLIRMSELCSSTPTR